MTFSRVRLLMAAGMCGVLACSGDSTGPAGACSSTTGSVTATVSVGGSVVFDWDPACAVALLLVEQAGSDQWAVQAPNLTSSSTETANIIVPPVTYGQVPPGAEQLDAPAALTPGEQYELVLWKVIPPGSTASCQAKSQNACLLTVKAFQR